MNISAQYAHTGIRLYLSTCHPVPSAPLHLQQNEYDTMKIPYVADETENTCVDVVNTMTEAVTFQQLCWVLKKTITQTIYHSWYQITMVVSWVFGVRKACLEQKILMSYYKIFQLSVHSLQLKILLILVNLLEKRFISISFDAHERQC